MQTLAAPIKDGLDVFLRGVVRQPADVEVARRALVVSNRDGDERGADARLFSGPGRGGYLCEGLHDLGVERPCLGPVGLGNNFVFCT